MASFGKESRGKLNTVDPKLQRLFEEVVKEFDCTILEGKRTMERQQELYNSIPPRTKTMNSKHLTGKAVDVMPYPVDWNDRERLEKFALHVYHIAMLQGVRVRWGGTFKGFYDGPHWELI